MVTTMTKNTTEQMMNALITSRHVAADALLSVFFHLCLCKFFHILSMLVTCKWRIKTHKIVWLHSKWSEVIYKIHTFHKTNIDNMLWDENMKIQSYWSEDENKSRDYFGIVAVFHLLNMPSNIEIPCNRVYVRIYCFW